MNRSRLTGGRLCTTVSCMSKSDVYSWRISPETRAALELEARREGTTIAALLDRLAGDWLLRGRRPAPGAEEAEQARLHAAAATTFGTIAGGDARRAERARAAVRERLTRGRGR